MKTLQGMLNDFLRPTPVRKTDPAYAAWRRFVALHKLSYQVARDGYIEIARGAAFPRGLTTSHFSWGETLERAEHCLVNPSAIDKEGYYTE